MRRRKRRDFPPYTKDRDIDIITPLFEAAKKGEPLPTIVTPTEEPNIAPEATPAEASNEEPDKVA